MIFVSTAFASSTSGTIDATNRYAWTENAGWLDFGGSYGSVSVTDSAISGYAYGENIGWVSLNCSNDTSCAAVDYKVANNGEGTLTGYAWGENAGWIKFNPDNGGVSIDSVLPRSLLRANYEILYSVWQTTSSGLTIKLC